MQLTLVSNSMAHTIDRAVGFRFSEPAYVCVEVTPSTITLQRRKVHGVDTIHLVTYPASR